MWFLFMFWSSNLLLFSSQFVVVLVCDLNRSQNGEATQLFCFLALSLSFDYLTSEQKQCCGSNTDINL